MCRSGDPITPKVFGKRWTAKEHPLYAAWIKANEPAIAALRKAMKRPRWFDPLVATADGFPMLGMSPWSSWEQEVSSYLSARANWRWMNGNVAGGWRDLMLLARMARG